LFRRHHCLGGSNARKHSCRWHLSQPLCDQRRLALCDGSEHLTVTIGALAKPTITAHPASQTITAGNTATFTVTATGGAPLTYQWQKNGANIAGAISASYTITNAQSTDAANYRCVVTNPAGAATSTPATLTVTPANPGGGGTGGTTPTGGNSSGGGGGGGAPSLLYLVAAAALAALRAAKRRK